MENEKNDNIKTPEARPQTTIFNIASVRKKIKKKMNDILTEFFKDKYYQVSEKDDWSNIICNEVIKQVSNEFNGLKLVCVGFIVDKGNAPFFHDANCLWDTKADGLVMATYENQYMNCLITLYVLSP